MIKTLLTLVFALAIGGWFLWDWLMVDEEEQEILRNEEYIQRLIETQRRPPIGVNGEVNFDPRRVLQC